MAPDVNEDIMLMHSILSTRHVTNTYVAGLPLKNSCHGSASIASHSFFPLLSMQCNEHHSAPCQQCLLKTGHQQTIQNVSDTFGGGPSSSFCHILKTLRRLKYPNPYIIKQLQSTLERNQHGSRTACQALYPIRILIGRLRLSGQI